MLDIYSHSHYDSDVVLVILGAIIESLFHLSICNWMDFIFVVVILKNYKTGYDVGEWFVGVKEIKMYCL